MNKTQQMINAIRAKVQKKELTAQQNKTWEKPEAGMLVRTLNLKKNPDFFYLVTEVGKDFCDVIPGSLYGLMAGEKDIVLPDTVLGDYIFLSLQLAATLPINTLGKGFAMLDNQTYNRVIDSQIKFETGVDGDMPPYPFAMPYLSKHDPRYLYHRKLAKTVMEAQKNVFACVFGNNDSDSEEVRKYFVSIFPTAEIALAAGPEQGNLYAECKITGFSSIFTFQYEFSKKILRLKVFDASQNPINDFDGWTLIDRTGKSIGTLKDSKCIVMNFELIDGKLGLTDLKGKIHGFIVKRC